MKPKKRVLISAGELSGELLAVSLIQLLKDSDYEIEFVGIAGPLLQAQGVVPWINSSELSVMGFFEVIGLLPKLIQIEEKLFSLIDRHKPDLAILVDYPGFHFRIAPSLRVRGIPVVQYVAPKVWAWGEHRVAKLKTDFDLVLGVLPFEADYFQRQGVPYVYVGSPHIDRIAQDIRSEEHQSLDDFLTRASHDAPEEEVSSFSSIRSRNNRVELSGTPTAANLTAAKWMTLLPGSRRSEIKMMLPPLIQIAQKMLSKNKNYRFAIPVASGLDFQWMVNRVVKLTKHIPVINESYAEVGPIRLYKGHSLDLMRLADFAVVTSGTATLECALLETPLCVVYRMNKLSYWVAKRRIKVKWIGLVNLCAEKEIAKEFVQDLNPEVIAHHIHDVISNQELYQEAKKDLHGLKSKFHGNAERVASQKILDILGKT